MWLERHLKKQETNPVLIPKGICADTYTVEHIPNDLEKGMNSEATESVNDDKLFKAGYEE